MQHRILCTTALMLAFVCLLMPVVEAAPAFGVKDVEGPTAFAFDGFATVLVGGTPTQVPAAAVGRFVADGAGHLNDGARTLVVGGTTFRETFTCTYTVEPNGTGKAECDVVGGPNAKESFDFVIVEKKTEAFFTATTPGVTIRGATKRQQ